MRGGQYPPKFREVLTAIWWGFTCHVKATVLKKGIFHIFLYPPWSTTAKEIFFLTFSNLNRKYEGAFVSDQTSALASNTLKYSLAKYFRENIRYHQISPDKYCRNSFYFISYLQYESVMVEMGIPLFKTSSLVFLSCFIEYITDKSILQISRILKNMGIYW